jgi:phage baseplate assembly protein gpV
MTDELLVRLVLSLQREVAALRRMAAGTLRFGTVRNVDTERKAVQLLLSDQNGREFLTPWRPWGEIAGDEKSWRPPTPGQQMMMVAPHGDLRQSVALPMTFSDQNPSPSSDEATRIISKYGDGLLTFTDGGARAEFSAPRVDLGGSDGKRVARIGDRVRVSSGSSSGLWPIVEGSETVFAVD